jgi:hypothetical protein
MRSLSNPGLQVFICCFNAAESVVMTEKFKGCRNVQTIALDGEILDFTAFNEKVLSWSNGSKMATSEFLASGAASTAEGKTGHLL